MKQNLLEMTMGVMNSFRNYLLPMLAGCFLTILASCTSAAEEAVVESLPDLELRQVSVSFSDFVVVTTSGSSTSTRTVTNVIPETLNRLTCAVFTTSGTLVASLSQKKEELKDGEVFGNLSFQIPIGTYKFVAVLHEVPSNKLSLASATISSPTLATLPGNFICDTYCCAVEKQVTADAGNTATVELPLGTRINAQFQLETNDVVPSNVYSILVTINTSATQPVPELPTFNPSTGYASSSWKYTLNLLATHDEKFNRSFSILLTDASLTTDVNIKCVSQENNFVSGYERTLKNVNFQRNHITHAVGNLFFKGVASSLTIDTQLGSEIGVGF